MALRTATRRQTVMWRNPSLAFALVYVILTYVARSRTTGEEVEAARHRLTEAEREYQRARTDDYVSRDIRDSAIVNAHRAGLSSREISELVGDIGQPNVVRARRRALLRREVVPDGLFSPADALRFSGLSSTEFITLVRNGRLQPVDLPGGVRAFRKEDIEQALKSA